MTSPLGSGRDRFRQLVLAHGRETLRDGRGMLSLLFTFGGMLLALALIDLVLAEGTGARAPGAVIGAGVLAASLPLVALVGFAGIAFVSTAVPLVSYRATGVLRQLSTTPANRTAFLLACLPARLGLGLAQIVLLLLSAGLFADHSPGALARTAALLLSGLFFLLSLGCLVGARFRDPDRTMHFSFVVTLALIATSGVALPFAALPQGVVSVVSWLPSTLLARSLTAELVGAPSPAPFWAVLLALVGSAAAILILSGRVFRWHAVDASGPLRELRGPSSQSGLRSRRRDRTAGPASAR